jgi:hypothetical protein
MRLLLVTSVMLASLGAAAGPKVFTGTITDEMCATSAGHAQMRMGPTDAECTVACVEAHGARYVLYDGKNAYILSDQKTPATLAGRRVKVAGALDSKTRIILVTSMTATK